MENKIYKTADKEILDLKKFPKNSKIHFIGLGGIGMSALARILQQAGYKISGSDLNKNHLMEYFKENGAEIYIGHSAININNSAMIIKSSAIKDNNPEYQKAKELKIPVIHRAELLNAIMTGFGQKSIGVTGTHGKTTTTGMISTIFHCSGKNPGFAIGGEIPELKTNSAFGKGNYFISELDESDGTIVFYSPEISIITNLELEHADHYKNGFEQLLSTMEKFINQTPENAKIIINKDDSGNISLMNKVKSNKYITFSLESDQADYYGEITAVVPDGNFKVYKKNIYLGNVKLGIPGKHNISNALAAIAASLEAGADFNEIINALARFSGMKKRFQTVGYANKARLIDDYAHHPTEIKATINTTRNIVDNIGKGRVLAVFQPHRYTRLKKFWNEFLESFDKADIVYVCDVYSAEEFPVEGISSKEFTQELKHKNAYYIEGNIEQVAERLAKEIKADDIVLTMGAGNITKLCGLILEKSGINPNI